MPIEEIVFRFRYYILIFLIGALLIGLGIIFSKENFSNNKVEVLDNENSQQIVIEIAGEVEKPGVYRFSQNSRVEDALVAAGGLSVNADRVWVEKILNRAAVLSDGQKIYIPALNQQTLGESANNLGGSQTIQETSESGGSGLVNINLASQKQLDSLPGIGPVYAQNIIEHRPYSNIEELVSKSVLTKSVFEKIKEKISVY